MMKDPSKPLMMLIVVVLAGFLGFLVWSNYSLANPGDSPPPPPTGTGDVVSVTSSPLPSREPEGTPELPTGIDTDSERYSTARLAVAGDMVMHTGLNAEAKRGDGYDYTTVFGGASKFLSEADYAICTMETTFSGGPEYTGYPMFASPDALAWSMKDVGIDMVNLASNHCMDTYQKGLNRTIQVLNEAGLDHIGTYETQEQRDANNGIVVKEIDGITIAFLSYAYGTNGMPVTGFEYAVNIFFNDYLTSLSDINYDLIKKDMAAARALETDVIAVIMHWGIEYSISPAAYQTEIADFLFKEGADLILGSHPHAPQPMEVRTVVDNEGREKLGYICYSAGNFISCQNDRYTKITAVINIELVKDWDTGETVIHAVDYVPMFMIDLTDYNISAEWRYQLWNLHEAINAYEAGNNWGVITPALYQDMVSQLEDLHLVFDPSLDRYMK